MLRPFLEKAWTFADRDAHCNPLYPTPTTRSTRKLVHHNAFSPARWGRINAGSTRLGRVKTVMPDRGVAWLTRARTLPRYLCRPCQGVDKRKGA